MSQHEMSFHVSQDVEAVMEALRQTASHLHMGVIESGPRKLTVKSKGTTDHYSCRIDFVISENKGTDIRAHGSMFGVGPRIQGWLQADMGGFINALSVRLANSVSSQKPNPNTDIDLASQLEQLARLKEQGVLSPDEFETAKKRVLGL
jgi:hypothetical protein